MLIQCPACRARAKLPDSKEGSKVRCGECGRVYLAVPAGQGARAGGGSKNAGLWIGLGAAVVIVIAVVIVRNFGGGDVEPVRAAKQEPAPVQAAPADATGWKSAPVQAAADVHRAAFAGRTDSLMLLIEPARVWERRQAETTAEGLTPPGREEFLLLDSREREDFLFAVASSMIEGEDKALIADWEPYDGTLVEGSSDASIVRLAVTPRAEGDAEKRWVEWRLVHEGGRWKAWSWERWLSPDEQKAERARQKRDRGYEKVTLSDGSKVLEREPEPLGHLDSTPPELRAEIDRHYATLINLDLTKESSKAMRDLVEIGKPAIPILLTGLYEIPLDTVEQSIQVNLIDQTLCSITGQNFGYKPQELVGSGAGTTRERRESAIRQWFAWWYRNQDTFEKKEVVDHLEGKLQLTEREKRELERDG